MTINLEEAKRTYLNSLKTDWDSYFMNIATIVAIRSLDPDTKIGCVIVDHQNRVLSLGYNGPIQGLPNDKVPLTRPHKYMWLLHAEQNALSFCNNNMSGATAYITGFPCNTCFKLLVQKGIKRIVHGSIMPACITEDEKSAIIEMANLKGVILEPLK